MSTPDAGETVPRRLRRRVGGAVVFVTGFLVTTVGQMNVGAAYEADGGMSNGGVLLWLLALAAWGTFFVRRRRPWVTAGAGLAMAVIGVEYLLLLIGALHLLTSESPRRRRVVGAATVATVALFWSRETFGGGPSFFRSLDTTSDLEAAVISGICAVASLAVLFTNAALTRSRRRVTAADGRAAAERARVRVLGDEVARQAEREEIAREIHDGLTNRLALLAMMGGNVERAVDSADPGAGDLARQLKSQSRAALADLRGLVQGLRDGPAAPPAPLTGMREVGGLIADARAAGAGVNATVLLEGLADISPSLGAAVHRMVQESLTNALKHAPGATISLYLEADPRSGVRLRVTNPLVTLPDPHAARGAGAGLLGIAERAGALHGTAWTAPHGDEFIVDVTLPWEAPDGASPASDGAPQVAP